jgi:hypothetical protein
LASTKVAKPVLCHCVVRVTKGGWKKCHAAKGDQRTLCVSSHRKPMLWKTNRVSPASPRPGEQNIAARIQRVQLQHRP